ncbi:MAG: PCRF domain-containing protein, partial [Polyangiaceae bacterium]|nr:PCRF domain-containing protein [Polyangiaceae bacterium]
MLPREKLDHVTARYSELEDLLCRPDIAADGKRFMQLSRERADLAEIVEAYKRFRDTSQRLAEDREALRDPELRELVEEEIPQLEAELLGLEEEINILLLPKDPNDQRNTILEIRAGTGGEEAALFAADLLRMYLRFAEKQRWKVELTSVSEAAAGGIKEAIAMVSGERVYSRLRFEGGV